MSQQRESTILPHRLLTTDDAPLLILLPGDAEGRESAVRLLHSEGWGWDGSGGALHSAIQAVRAKIVVYFKLRPGIPNRYGMYRDIPSDPTVRVVSWDTLWNSVLHPNEG
jgi:hypothetical protein